MKEKAFEDLLDLHVRFVRIHPFQDDNGRAGRLILFKEYLRNKIVPFIIGDDMKMLYYRRLNEWDREKGCLTDPCLAAQGLVKKISVLFRFAYQQEINMAHLYRNKSKDCEKINQAENSSRERREYLKKVTIGDFKPLHSTITLVDYNPHWKLPSMCSAYGSLTGLNTACSKALCFRDRLRTNEADREKYAQVKRELARRVWDNVQDYADEKTAVVSEIMERAVNAE